LPETGNVKLFNTDMMGQQVAGIYDGYKSSGSHSIVFNGSGLTSGVYFYTLETMSGRITKKMMLMK
ncbi:MAG: T9SS type A sorting domain-containing protein, partial [Ignavibacteriaceae bacterium]|nr:T9SS type A sorting domain-containing protein [Ignavibacteriaceae bacterium]